MTGPPDTEAAQLADTVLSAVPDEVVVFFMFAFPTTAAHLRAALSEDRVTPRLVLAHLWRRGAVAPMWLADVERVLTASPSREDAS